MKKSIKSNLIMTPLPVLIIGTYDDQGIPNAMNAAWGTQSYLDEITITLSPHKTTDNLKIKKAFTVAFATKDTLVASDYFGIASGKNGNKVAQAKMHVKKAEKVDAPVIEEYPVTIECLMKALEPDGDGFRLIGKVVNVQAEESVLDAQGHLDLGKLQLLCFDSASNTYRVIGEVVGQAFKDGLSLMK
ncbi:MAG: flavin reductase [Bacteriovoracaceae bacterium]|nr:flavin reductase [Bacteriovoracaceae bacterium]